jgi:hypothetical protein
MLQTPASIEAAVATAIDRFGSVDVLARPEPRAGSGWSSHSHAG